MAKTFGRWNGVASAKEMVDGWIAGASDEPVYYGERVALWLRDHGVHGLDGAAAKVIGWCESGAEAMIASHFAPVVSELRGVADRTLGWASETLELQAQINGTPYRADFKWTSPNGVALVEVWGAAAHWDRRARDRIRHARLTELGYAVHYVPAETVINAPGAAWSALRRRQREARGVVAHGT